MTSLCLPWTDKFMDLSSLFCVQYLQHFYEGKTCWFRLKLKRNYSNTESNWKIWPSFEPWTWSLSCLPSLLPYHWASSRLGGPLPEEHHYWNPNTSVSFPQLYYCRFLLCGFMSFHTKSRVLPSSFLSKHPSLNLRVTLFLLQVLLLISADPWPAHDSFCSSSFHGYD